MEEHERNQPSSRDGGSGIGRARRSIPLIPAGVVIGGVLAATLMVLASCSEPGASSGATRTVTATATPQPTVLATITVPGPRVTVTKTVTPAAPAHDWEKIVEFGDTASREFGSFYVPERAEKLRVCWNYEGSGAFKATIVESASSPEVTVVDHSGATSGCQIPAHYGTVGSAAPPRRLPLTIGVTTAGGAYQVWAEWR